MCHAGPIRSAIGSTTMPPRASAQRRCRVAAAARYQTTRTSSASTISSVALIRISSTGFDMSAPLFLGLRDERRQPFQLGLIQRDVGEIEQRGGGRGARSVEEGVQDRKSTRLNSSHLGISYAVFCL